MKKQYLTLFAIVILTSLTFGQNISTGSGNRYEMSFIPSETIDNSAEFKRIAHKMYASNSYLPAKIDDLTELVPIKYNIYKDEMEFSKNGQILNLVKKYGRTVFFSSQNKKYEVFKFEDKLQYFISHNLGNNRLLIKQIVKFVDAKPAASSYQKDRPANFKRKSDELYLKINDNVVEIPRRKKKFYALFDSNSSKIKKFIKFNKLSIKKVNDLKKIIEYSNTI